MSFATWFQEVVSGRYFAWRCDDWWSLVSFEIELFAFMHEKWGNGFLFIIRNRLCCGLESKNEKPFDW